MLRKKQTKIAHQNQTDEKRKESYGVGGESNVENRQKIKQNFTRNSVRLKLGSDVTEKLAA